MKVDNSRQVKVKVFSFHRGGASPVGGPRHLHLLGRFLLGFHHRLRGKKGPVELLQRWHLAKSEATNNTTSPEVGKVGKDIFKKFDASVFLSASLFGWVRLIV